MTIDTNDTAAPTPAPDAVDPGLRSRWHAPLTRKVYEWARILLVAVVLMIGLRAYVVETFYIPSGSMIPTLHIGDRILVDRLWFSAHNIHRGDIIVFRRTPADHDPQHPADLVKRVIGLPGETISSRGDTIYINHHPIAESWLPNFNAQPTRDYCSQAAFHIRPQRIPADAYFVMGDCRGNSADSRSWGTVPASYIVGKVFLVIWRNNHPFFHWF